MLCSRQEKVYCSSTNVFKLGCLVNIIEGRLHKNTFCGSHIKPSQSSLLTTITIVVGDETHLQVNIHFCRELHYRCHSSDDLRFVIAMCYYV